MAIKKLVNNIKITPIRCSIWVVYIQLILSSHNFIIGKCVLIILPLEIQHFENKINLILDETIISPST